MYKQFSNSLPEQPMFEQPTTGDTSNLSSVVPTDPTLGLATVSGRASNSSVNPGVKGNETEWQKVMNKQKRLLLLRHASKCQHEAGKCPVTPHCASMKGLWEHIAQCKNRSCSFQHCLSSRHTLSHFQRCKDLRCPACRPVHQIIRMSSTASAASARHLSFDNTTGSDVVAPPRSSISPSPSAASSSYEREPKRVKTEAPVPVLPIPSSSVVASIASWAPAVLSKPPTRDCEILVGDCAEKVRSAVMTGSVDHSLLNSFTVKQPETHSASLESRMCRQIRELEARRVQSKRTKRPLPVLGDEEDYARPWNWICIIC